MEEEKQLTIIEEPETVAEIEATDLDQVTQEYLDNMLEQDALLRSAALKHSQGYHWESFDGENARLNRRGADYLARLFGIAVQVLEKSKMIERDNEGNLTGHYQYNVSVRAIMKSRSFDYIGCCDTNNSFLSRGGKLRPDQIDETQVLRKATANGIANAVGRLLNLSMVPLDELKAHSTKIKSIKYAGRKK